MLLEEGLRKFLKTQKTSNESIMEYYYQKLKDCEEKETQHYCGRIAALKRLKETSKDLKELQIFQLTDLIRYTNSKFDLGIDSGKISELRNNVMHFKMLVRYETTDNEDNDSGHVYDYKTFEKLMGNLDYLASLLKDFK